MLSPKMADCSISANDRNQEVTAWHEHVIGGTDSFIMSATSIPNDERDELWIAVRRTINGQTKYYIELANHYEFDEQEDLFYVDSGLTLDEPFAVVGITQANPAVVTTSTRAWLCQ